MAAVSGLPKDDLTEVYKLETVSPPPESEGDHVPHVTFPPEELPPPAPRKGWFDSIKSIKHSITDYRNSLANDVWKWALGTSTDTEIAEEKPQSQTTTPITHLPGAYPVGYPDDFAQSASEPYIPIVPKVHIPVPEIPPAVIVVPPELDADSVPILRDTSGPVGYRAAFPDGIVPGTEKLTPETGALVHSKTATSPVAGGHGFFGPLYTHMAGTASGIASSLTGIIGNMWFMDKILGWFRRWKDGKPSAQLRRRHARDWNIY